MWNSSLVLRSQLQVEVNGFHPKALVFVSEKRCAFAAGKLIVEMDVESKKQRSPGSTREWMLKLSEQLWSWSCSSSANAKVERPGKSGNFFVKEVRKTDV